MRASARPLAAIRSGSVRFALETILPALARWEEWGMGRHALNGVDGLQWVRKRPLTRRRKCAG
jgi:hypothetical protein